MYKAFKERIYQFHLEFTMRLKRLTNRGLLYLLHFVIFSFIINMLANVMFETRHFIFITHIYIYILFLIFYNSFQAYIHFII